MSKIYISLTDRDKDEELIIDGSIRLFTQLVNVLADAIKEKQEANED